MGIFPIISVGLGAGSVAVGLYSIRLYLENRQLRQRLGVLGERPCIELKLLFEDPRDASEMAAVLRRIRDVITREEQQRVIREGEAEIPLCLWGEIVKSLCEHANLRLGVRTFLDREGVQEAERLLVKILRMLVARKISGPATALDILQEFVPECPDDGVVRGAEVAGLVCEACADGSKSVHHEKACELFKKTVQRLGSFYPRQEAVWEKIVVELVVHRMASLCLNGKTLRDLVSAVWQTVVIERNCDSAVSYIGDMLAISPARQALRELSDADRESLVGMVQAKIDFDDRTLEGILKEEPNSKKRKRKLDIVIRECGSLKRTIATAGVTED